MKARFKLGWTLVLCIGQSGILTSRHLLRLKRLVLSWLKQLSLFQPQKWVIFHQCTTNLGSQIPGERSRVQEVSTNVNCCPNFGSWRNGSVVIISTTQIGVTLLWHRIQIDMFSLTDRVRKTFWKEDLICRFLLGQNHDGSESLVSNSLVSFW